MTGEAVARRDSLLRRLRSTPGRQLAVSTVGNANTTSRISTGLTDASSTIVTPSRRIHPAVENTDMYMWSSVNT